MMNSVPVDIQLTSSVVRLPVFEGDLEIAEGLAQGRAAALDALYVRYSKYVRSILVRVLGTGDPDLSDLVQDVFEAAFFQAIPIHSPERLRAWLTSIAVHKALDRIRKRQRGRWLQFFAPDRLPELRFESRQLEDREAVEAVYRILEKIPPLERVPFVLQRLEKMPLADIAASCGVSLATTKRRIAAAAKRFEALASQYPELEDWLDQSGHWRHV